jgi:5-methylcytosine-specific restriction endonuclease McrA
MVFAHVCSKCGVFVPAQLAGRCRGCRRPERSGSSRPELDRYAWQKLRRAARLRDGNRCVACGSSERLSVHHAVVGSSLLEDLLTLCSRCHRREHADKLAASKASFLDRDLSTPRRQGPASFAQNRGEAQR